jgi:hypothetical protein
MKSAAEQLLEPLADEYGASPAKRRPTALDTHENSTLDERTYYLVRLAALVTLDAPPTSFIAGLRSGGESKVAVDDVHAVMRAIAPLVGSGRVASGIWHFLRALQLCESEELVQSQ